MFYWVRQEKPRLAPPGPGPASPPLPAGPRQAPWRKPHQVGVGECPTPDPRRGPCVTQAPLPQGLGQRRPRHHSSAH